VTVKRWEDIIPVWQGPSYGALALGYHASVTAAPLAGRLISCPEVVDWDGDGGRDLLVSCWDACYEGGLYLLEDSGRRADGTPDLLPARRIDGVTGYVTAVPDGERFHLLSTSRTRADLWLYPQIGTRAEPRFGEPLPLPVAADWLHEGELMHLARLVDIQGDRSSVLLIGTDCWGDYWPDRREWNEKGYRAYDGQGRWRGGPLRGHLYRLENRGSARRPQLSRGVPLAAGGRQLESYGKLAATVGRFGEGPSRDLVWGDFLDRLHVVPGQADGSFGPPSYLADGSGRPLELDHCIHFPVAVDWDGDGRLDLLVGAEDGYVSWLRHAGSNVDGRPAFHPPVRLQTARPRLHAGVLPVPAAHDWSGDGRPDLIVGNSAGEILFYPNVGTAERPEFGPEVQCRAGGKPIRLLAGPTGSIQGPSEAKFGYSCPTVADWDGDGRPDLLVTDITGAHYFYRNAGGSGPPAFERPVALLFQGRPLTTVWRVRPAVVDWLGDGALSYVCLDENGLLASYRRFSDSSLTAKRLLRFAGGAAVAFTEDFGGGRGRIKLCICDWTCSGRYDLIIGTHSRASVPPGSHGVPRHTTRQAGVFLLKNVGSNADPSFAPPRAICYRGEPIRLGMHSCAPETVDWSGKGEVDLVVGAEDGSLLWFRRPELSW
jgi:hypothetical protein